MRIACQRCKEEVDVAMYLYNHMITKEQSLFEGLTEYRAAVLGKAICPCCGNEMHEKFSSLITGADIAELAIGKELNK